MYSTLNDIKERIPERTIIQLTDDDKLGVVDQAKVDAAIERADALIDSYCGKRYQVPFTTVPAVVVEISADLAGHFLFTRMGAKIPEARENVYRDQVALLKDISKGVISLGVAPAPEQPSGSGASFVSGSRQMTRDKLRDM